MKRRATTVEGIRFEPHFLRGYRGTINGRRVVVQQDGERDWIVRHSFSGFGYGAIGGGRTMREAVKMAKERGA